MSVTYPNEDKGASTEMWEGYWADPSDRVKRNVIVERYLYLVNREVRLATHRPSVMFDTADLRQIALIALIAAVEKWVPARNDNFEAWATFRIRNDISQALRTIADPLSRTLRSRLREIDSATDYLSVKLGREPTRAEIASYLGIDESRLRQWELDIATRPQDSLEAKTHGTLDVFDETDVESQAIRNEAHSRLMEALDELTPEERELVVRVNIEGDTMASIASDLGVSRATARARYSRAFERLCREFLDPLT